MDTGKRVVGKSSYGGINLDMSYLSFTLGDNVYTNRRIYVDDGDPRSNLKMMNFILFGYSALCFYIRALMGKFIDYC